MSETHVLKIKEQFADDICSGRKTFEVRREDDKHFAAGDKIVFEVVDEQGDGEGGHAVNRKQYRVEYVLRGWGVKKGYAVLSFKADRKKNKEEERVSDKKDTPEQRAKAAAVKTAVRDDVSRSASALGCEPDEAELTEMIEEGEVDDGTQAGLEKVREANRIAALRVESNMDESRRHVPVLVILAVQVLAGLILSIMVIEVGNISLGSGLQVMTTVIVVSWLALLFWGRTRTKRTGRKPRKPGS